MLGVKSVVVMWKLVSPSKHIPTRTRRSSSHIKLSTQVVAQPAEVFSSQDRAEVLEARISTEKPRNVRAHPQTRPHSPHIETKHEKVQLNDYTIDEPLRTVQSKLDFFILPNQA